MTKSRLAAISIAGIAFLTIFYEIDFVLEFGGTTIIEQPDPAVEALYDRCFLEKDESMHAEAFATIDNPDVQREFISANRQRIEADCRAEYPLRNVQVTEDKKFNLIEVRPRFW